MDFGRGGVVPPCPGCQVLQHFCVAGNSVRAGRHDAAPITRLTHWLVFFRRVSVLVTVQEDPSVRNVSSSFFA